jgi:plastocyanin
LDRASVLAATLCLAALAGMPSHAQGVSVSAHLAFARTTANSTSTNGVVVWLTPVHATTLRPAPAHAPFRLVQKNKEFTPHLTVVPVGSSVEFPNLDPFFHNVFSLFNGKRFDLGLYEAGSSRSVRFDREGVSYLFCNIHPAMGAIVLALATPYYAVATSGGDVTVGGVPPGDYQLHVWGEQVKSGEGGTSLRELHVGPAELHLGTLTLEPTAGSLADHKNKFGEEYAPDSPPPYK